MRTSSVAALVLAGMLWGCASPPPKSNLTPGMAKNSIFKGETTQAQVMEIFGPPDLVTHRDGADIWTWDKVRSDFEVTDTYLTLLVFGTAGQKISSSSTSTMLIVYFDEHDIVRDYRLNTTRF